MSKWKNLNINSNLVEKETERAVLFNMPKNSEYKGWQFWHPKKCVREGKHSAALSLGYTNDWDFKFIKQWKDGTHKEEKKISVADFEKAFDLINDNIEEAAKSHATKVAKGIEETTTKLERKLNKMPNVEHIPLTDGTGDSYIACPGDGDSTTTVWWHYALQDDGSWRAACWEKKNPDSLSMAKNYPKTYDYYYAILRDILKMAKECQEGLNKQEKATR